MTPLTGFARRGPAGSVNGVMSDTEDLRDALPDDLNAGHRYTAACSAALPAWLASLDQSGAEIDEDGAGLHHDC